MPTEPPTTFRSNAAEFVPEVELRILVLPETLRLDATVGSTLTQSPLAYATHQEARGRL